MTHGFKPITTEQSIQVAILDELQKISGLLGPSAPTVAELPAEPVADAPAEPEPKKAPAKKASAKTARKTVTGQ